MRRRWRLLRLMSDMTTPATPANFKGEFDGDDTVVMERHLPLGSGLWVWSTIDSVIFPDLLAAWQSGDGRGVSKASLARIGGGRPSSTGVDTSCRKDSGGPSTYC